MIGMEMEGRCREAPHFWIVESAVSDIASADRGIYYPPSVHGFTDVPESWTRVLVELMKMTAVLKP
jgi:hypothetical protein